MLNIHEPITLQPPVWFTRCPECQSNKLVTDRSSGEIVCSTCGLVITDLIIDHRPEWRAFTFVERETKVRIGSPISLKRFDKGLSTTFRIYADTNGKAFPLTERLKLRRLQRWNHRARVSPSTDQNLSRAMNELTRIADNLHIPIDVMESAAFIYRKALKADLIRGRSINGIVAGALHVACRLNQTPRSLKEFVETNTQSHKEISRCSRLIQQELDIRLPIDDPETYIPKIASKVGLNATTQRLAIALIHTAKKIKVVVGKAPRGIAAAALYIASRMNHDKITQKKLANAAEVTEVTVRNRYKSLLKDLELKAYLKKGSKRAPHLLSR